MLSPPRQPSPLFFACLIAAGSSPALGFIWLKVPPNVRLAILGMLGAGAAAAGSIGDNQNWVVAVTAALTGLAAGTGGARDFVGKPPA